MSKCIDFFRRCCVCLNFFKDFFFSFIGRFSRKCDNIICFLRENVFWYYKFLLIGICEEWGK